MRSFLVVAALVLLALAPAAAQEHEHKTGVGMAMVLHDGPDSGRAVVGGLTHFGFALINGSVPQVHRNAEFAVLQDGVVVFQTNDTHEYDGLFSFDYTFTRTGPYVVMAMSKDMQMGLFQGEAVLPVNESVARVEFAQQQTGNILKGTLSIVDEAGALLPHTDAIVELRQAGDERLVSRFHLHIHDAPMVFEQALPVVGAGGDFVMRVTASKAFATGRATSGPDVRAVAASFPIKMGNGVEPPALPTSPGAPPELLEPMGAKATAEGFTFYGMYDPQNQVGVGQTIRLAGIIQNESGPLPHVDFDLKVVGPRGQVFASKTLHEYDGVLEYLFVPDAPGWYEATMTAIMDESKLTVPFHFQVVPPALAAFPGNVMTGPGIVTVKGLEAAQAGVPTELTFDIRGPQGPVAHSEVDVTIFRKDAAPLYQFKLHTHASGQTRATVVFPDGGDWLVQVDPLPTSPQPVVFAGPGGLGAPIVFAAKVEGSAPPLVVTPQAVATQGEQRVPGVGALALVGIGALVALAARRRA